MGKRLVDLSIVKVATIMAAGLVAVGMSAQIGSEARNCRIFPYELGGFPAPFNTKVCDHNGNGTPESTSLLSIGPGYLNSQVREPTQEEIDWYRSQI